MAFGKPFPVFWLFYSLLLALTRSLDIQNQKKNGRYKHEQNRGHKAKVVNLHRTSI